jgi:hypothetical protein
MTKSLSDRLRREAAAMPKTAGDRLSERVIDAVRAERKPLPFPSAPRRWAPTALIAAGLLAACWVAMTTQRVEPPRDPGIPAQSPEFNMPDLTLAASTALLVQDPLTSELLCMRADISCAGTFLVASMPSLPR